MRLLTWDSQQGPSLTADLADDKIPPYAILSHTWADDDDELTFADVQRGGGQSKAGYQKVRFCGERACQDKIEHFWVDTCCINKAEPGELSEAITSMYRWYREAQKCYVYLSDVSIDGSNFRRSRWFTRGWTLQELLAPRVVEFLSREAGLLGTKETLAQQIHEITTIPLAALRNAPLDQFPIAERIRWRENRTTKKLEDQAYCLLGIFNVFMPLIYGERDNALRRLQEEVNKKYGADAASALSNNNATRSFGLCLKSAPFIQPSDFVGRAGEIATIHGFLRPDETPREQQRVVLGGMGGMGKTQLAIAYARQYQDSYTSVFWLNATSELTLYASVREVAQAFITAAKLEKLDNEQLLARVHEWLLRPDNTRWLLIFDNHDDPKLFDIKSFYPSVGYGSVIITTRLPDLIMGHQVRIQPFYDIDSSLAILQIRSGRKEVTQDTDARRLARRLDGLPLALVTAGAVLRNSTLTFQEYLDLYQRRWQVDARRPQRLPEYDHTLYTTWNLSYTQLKQDDPEAARMLQLLAYFDHQDIWYELCHAGRSDLIPEWLQSSLAERTSFHSVMRTLVDYCLVEAQYTSQSYSIHSCVHDWTLGELNSEIDPRLYWYAFDCVAASIDRDDWEALNQRKYSRVSPHGVRLTYHRFAACDETESGLSERLSKAVWTARMLQEQIQLSAAEQMYLRALAGCEKALGPDHTSTLSTVHNLGDLYCDQGKLDQAEQMYLRALAGYEKALEPDHTSTLTTVHNLGSLYKDQDKLDQAGQMYLRALAGYEKALGPDHTSTLTTVHNLGDLYRKQGKLDEAEQMYLGALAGYEKALGPDHTSTLSTVHNLGDLYRKQGKLDKAEQMYLRALAGKEKALEPDHTSTLATVHNLGDLYRKQGKLDKAEQMYLRALAGYEKALGPDHTSTLATVHNLGNLFRKQGKLDKAEQMHLQALAGYEKVLGPDHTSTLMIINNLGNLYYDQGKLDEAEQMYLQALAGCEKALGPDRTSTLTTVHNLGDLYRKQGKLDKAEQMYLRALTGYEIRLGQEHPRIRTVTCNLAELRRRSSDAETSSPSHDDNKKRRRRESESNDIVPQNKVRKTG